jgi:hypothetical protein
MEVEGVGVVNLGSKSGAYESIPAVAFPRQQSDDSEEKSWIASKACLRPSSWTTSMLIFRKLVSTGKDETRLPDLLMTDSHQPGLYLCRIVSFTIF